MRRRPGINDPKSMPLPEPPPPPPAPPVERVYVEIFEARGQGVDVMFARLLDVMQRYNVLNENDLTYILGMSREEAERVVREGTR